MKKFFAVFLLVFCAFFISCRDDKTKLKVIEDNEIFLMEEDAYWVFFVKEDCEHCERARIALIQYMETINSDKEKYKNNRKIYEVCLKKNGEKSSILRTYESVDGKGQGTDNKFYVNNVKEWDKLYIASTPSLIAIYEQGGVKRAKYLAQGASKVIAYVENSLG